MRELYVYWKAPAALDLSRLRSAMSDLESQHPGLRARLLRRADTAADPSTWMEVYTATAGVSSELQRAIEARITPLLANLGAGPRHTEVFETPA